MKKYNMANLAAVFTVSFMAWCYCVATAVLGLVYQAYPGQDSKTVLIATLRSVYKELHADHETGAADNK